MENVTILLVGDIKNIGFLFQVMKVADEFHIYGNACYLNSDTVKIEIEGKEEDLDKFVDWIKHGGHGAKIADIKIGADSLHGFRDFTISTQQISTLQ